MKRLALTAMGIAVLCLGCVVGFGVAEGAAASKVVSASGGSISFVASVGNASTCRWSSSPQIAGFARTVNCKARSISRSAKFKANASATAKEYEITLTIRGKTTMIDRWKVNQAGMASPTTTTAPPTTTTTLKGSPTAVAIVASKSPATVGDTITYLMTVADVSSATQSSTYMTDNGVMMANCTGPIPTNQGSAWYSCSATYGNGDIGTHLVVGVFLGDASHGQSAGQLNEIVQATSTTTTTTSTTTTTTTTTTLPWATITMNIAATYSCYPSVCLYGTSVSDAPITGPIPADSYVDLTATAIASDGTDPSQGGIGDSWSVSEVGSSLPEGEIPGLTGSSYYGTASFQFAQPGTYNIRVAITGWNPELPDYGDPGSASIQVIVH